MQEKNTKQKEWIKKVHAEWARIDKEHAADGHGIGMEIQQHSTFAYTKIGRAKDAFAQKGKKTRIYSRLGNPNTDLVEKKLAALEGGEDAYVTSSGMSAVAMSLLPFLEPGDHIVSNKVVYGCTDDLFTHDFKRLRIDVSFIDTNDAEEIKKHIRPETKCVFVETPANPTMDITDIKALCDLVTGVNPDIVKVCDNTFASSYNQRPLELGCDIVMHSTTKFLNGHGDHIGGAVISSEKLIEPVRKAAINWGINPDPFSVSLLNRSLKTYFLRMEAHNKNGLAVAEYLSKQPAIKKVYHPAFDPAAAGQMYGFGSILSFEFADDLSVETIEAFCDNLRDCSSVEIAVSLGDTQSLIQWPAAMTHAIIPREDRLAKGITDRLIRLSVGIEDIDYLKEGFDAAFGKIR